MNDNIKNVKNITVDDLYEEIQKLRNEIAELRNIITMDKDDNRFDPRLLSMNY